RRGARCGARVLALLRASHAAQPGQRHPPRRGDSDLALPRLSIVRARGDGVVAGGVAAMIARSIAAALIVVAALAGASAAGGTERNFAGSVQLDYLAVPTDRHAHTIAFDGATVELSLKLTQDFGDSVTSQVKVCV